MCTSILVPVAMEILDADDRKLQQGNRVAERDIVQVSSVYLDEYSETSIIWPSIIQLFNFLNTFQLS